MVENKQPPEYIGEVYSRPRLRAALSVFSRAAVAFVAVSFIFSAAVLLFERWTVGCAYLFFTCMPFIMVSLMRAVINSPRPYELYAMPEKFKSSGRKEGRSFPSRHVFSAFVIGVMSLTVSPMLGCLLLFLGVCLGACRILLGIHFVKDVLAGAFIGAFSGTVGILIVNFCL